MGKELPKTTGERVLNDPLRTYDAWTKDKDGKPQTWEEYMSKKE